VKLDFLGDASYDAVVWQDGAEPTAVNKQERNVRSQSVLELRLAPSGGAAVRFAPRR